MNKFVSILFIVISSFLLIGCNNDEAINTEQSIFNTESIIRNKFDNWLLSNYINPYNIEVKYRMEDLESDMTHVLIPATYEKSIALMKIIKHVWMEAYDELVGINFLRKFVPKSMHLIGSPAYDDNGTMVLGTAEGGMKITLYNVNDLNLEKIDLNMLNTYYFRTMHHEFAHILHQTRNYDPAFDRITENAYIGNNWYIYTDPETGGKSSRTDEQAWQAGFVTPYSMSESREDFVENIAMYITHDQAYWDNMMEKAGKEGAAILKRKFTIVFNYMLETWEINLNELREVVLRRQSEVNRLDLTL